MERRAYDEVYRDLRATLKREVQLRQRNQDLEEILLRMKGKALMSIQEIDLELQRLAREDERHATAAEVHRMEPPR